MSYRFWCNNEDDHERDGRRDFERRGPYGYDRDKYRDPFNACHEAYTRGFDEARREEERRQERLEEKRQEERRAERRREEAREEERRAEEAYWRQEQEDEEAGAP